MYVTSPEVINCSLLNVKGKHINHTPKVSRRSTCSETNGAQDIVPQNMILWHLRERQMKEGPSGLLLPSALKQATIFLQKLSSNSHVKASLTQRKSVSLPLKMQGSRRTLITALTKFPSVYKLMAHCLCNGASASLSTLQ